MVLSRRKTRLFRAFAIVLGLLPFVVIELTLRGMHLPARPPVADPFVDLHNLRPLFVPVAGQEKGGEDRTVAIGASRLNLFRPASFKAHKPDNTFRIFALGGSTTQGEPFSTETAFPHWLGLCLEAAAPSTEVEVVNCGGLSYASYRVLAILNEILQYQPNLIVIYTGHNEYLERRSYAGYERESIRARSRSWLEQLRLVQQARVLLGRDGHTQRSLNQNRTELTEEVDALLDYAGGLQDYRRADDWHEAVAEHFRWNLREMVHQCQMASIPLILVNPVSNLSDCPPIKFESDPNMSVAERDRFESAWSSARQATSLESAMRAARVALDIDGEHAGVNYLIGKISLAQGDFQQAKRRLIRARDYDVCPLRATTILTDIISEIADVEQVLLVDGVVLLEEQSQHRIVGSEWLVDHIHPNIQGHQVLGKAMAASCIAAGFFTATDSEWQRQIDGLFERELARLGEAYFHRGQRRLEGLLLWTQGRALKVRSQAQ